ncbi:MAG: prepilin-type N-terminal cleavage/methylation domain-containing protein [Phycisphaerae bacterium]|nr:prepilin-type N-terminal cleavage/methylation domain-containing protein [Phycisphaerae bacterium]
MTKKHFSRAFTLVEVIIAITITGIILAALATALSGSLTVYDGNNQIAAINQAARVIMDRMGREMRMADNVDCSANLLKIYPDGPTDPYLQYSLNTDTGVFSYIQDGTSHELLGSEDDVSVQSFTIDLTQVLEESTLYTTLARIKLVLLIDGQSYSFTTSAVPRKNMDK